MRQVWHHSPMSTANMWSDDSDGSSSTQYHPPGPDHYAGNLPLMVQGPWNHFPASTTENNDTRPTEMELDEETLEGPQGAYWHHYMSDDDDDDEDGDNEGGAQVDILAVASVLSQGMDLAQSEDDVNPAAAFPAHQSAMGTGPGDIQYAPPVHMPPLFNPPTPNQYQTPLPPAFPPMIASALGQQANAPGAPLTAFNANAATHLHMQLQQHQHFPITHHPQILHPNAVSNPNANALVPENYNLHDFIRVWAWQYAAWQGSSRDRGRYPWPKAIEPQMAKTVSQVDYMDLEGDRCDVQGINWDDLGVTRSDARERRLLTYKNYVNVGGSDRWQENHDVLPCTENFFRFRRLHVRKNINLAHFQLRNVLASTSRSQVFYPGPNSVYEFNPITGKGKSGMRSRETPHFQVSTLAADHGVLVAGGFFGEYCFRRTSSESKAEVHEGTITTDNSGITNHVQLHLSRTSSGPKASFASNDNGFRVLDIETDKFISEMTYEKPVNCSAMSPDRRLRVMVGDQTSVLITKAEADGKPEILKTLGGHGDFGFSCDWANDGWTVATGFQDKSVKIWDARRWTNSQGMAAPVCTLRSEIAGCRSLKFSPLGSGKRVLVAAEEADFVNIYDAQTWQSKQTFDFFGEIGGTSFVNEGQDLQVLCCDPTRGGLFQLDRCGMGAERSHDTERPSFNRTWKNGSYDWQEFETTPRRLPRHSETHRRRRALAVDSLDPF